MNVEYVGTINNQKLTTKILFLQTFSLETFFTNWALHLFTIFFFVVILKAKITRMTVNCVIHFVTAGFTVPLGVVGSTSELKRKKWISKQLIYIRLIALWT